jgi:low temperature requirement protein LtrA
MITVQQMKIAGDRRVSVLAHVGGPTQLEQLGQPKASYAELFYDLFFVASLTSFGIKHEITQAQAIASYVAFFTVLWYEIPANGPNSRWVWTSQMMYDVRFETGDIIHRVFKFIQLLLLAAFAAFAGRFDVYYGFPDDIGLEDNSNPSYSERATGFFSFRGMTIVYIVSRAVLALQYLLLYFYARRKSYPASNQFLFQIGSLVVSGCMWIGSYFLEGDGVSDAMRIAKFGLWYGGIGLELVSTILIWLFCRVTGFRRTHLTERFSTLTLLILGEGVIGYAIALQSSLSFWYVR